MAWSRHTPWRQGHLLPPDAIAALGIVHSDSAEPVVIAISHDCDLAQLPEKEPDVEVIVGRQISVLDSRNTHAKSFRKLHLTFKGDDEFFAEFVITAKTSIPKENLVGFAPITDRTLSPSERTTLQLWLASRYRRSAFPDEFERRLTENKLDKKISKAMELHGSTISAVFFDVDEGQDLSHSGEDDVYLLDIYLLHPDEPDFQAAEATAIKAKGAIEKAFKDKLFDSRTGTWRNVELRYVEVISETTLTYQQSKFLKKWRLDYISLGSAPQQPVLAE